MTRLSKSKINTYLQCPRKYKFDVDAPYDREEPEEGTPLRIGLDVHELFEWYYKQPEAREIKEPYDVSMWKVFSKHPKAVDYVDFIDNFIEFNKVLIEERGVPEYLPIEIETKLHDSDLNFTGIIDAIYESNDGLVLIDYKTGKPRSIREYRLELVLYKILYEKVIGKEIRYIGVYFPKTDTFRVAKALRPGEEPPDKGAYVTIEDEMMAMATMDEVRDRIEEGFFPADPGFLCNYCDYINECKLEGMQDI